MKKALATIPAALALLFALSGPADAHVQVKWRIWGTTATFMAFGKATQVKWKMALDPLSGTKTVGVQCVLNYVEKARLYVGDATGGISQQEHEYVKKFVRRYAADPGIRYGVNKEVFWFGERFTYQEWEATGFRPLTPGETVHQLVKGRVVLRHCHPG